jgi:hypothetical protein
VTPLEEDATLPRWDGIAEAGLSRCELNWDSEALLAASSRPGLAGTAEKERKTWSDNVCGDIGVGFLETGFTGEVTGDGPDPGDLLSSRADSGSSKSGCLASSGMVRGIDAPMGEVVSVCLPRSDCGVKGRRSRPQESSVLRSTCPSSPEVSIVISCLSDADRRLSRLTTIS